MNRQTEREEKTDKTSNAAYYDRRRHKNDKKDELTDPTNHCSLVSRSSRVAQNSAKYVPCGYDGWASVVCLVYQRRSPNSRVI